MGGKAISATLSLVMLTVSFDVDRSFSEVSSLGIATISELEACTEA